MDAKLAKYGFKSTWDDIFIDSYEGYYPNMTDYHMHEYFEISIIISGNVNVLLSNNVESSTHSKIVLLPPFTPHYIYCEPDILYKRINICFSPEFIDLYSPEWKTAMHLFSKDGTVLKLSEDDRKHYIEITKKLEKETSIYRKKLLLMYLISLISENVQSLGEFTNLPGYITDALSYISTHYKEKIIADQLAQKIGISRTTLMTTFKKHTGTTVNDYLLGCRLKNAILLLQKGEKLTYVAEECGFTDAPNLIRCFKKHFGTTPAKYFKNK